MDYSKLSDKALAEIAKGKEIDYSKLEDSDLDYISQLKSTPAAAPAPVSTQPPLPSVGETALKSGVHGLTAGLDTRLAGVLGAGMDVVAQAQPEKSIVDLYREYRDLYKKDVKQGEEVNPGTALGSEIVGSIPQFLIPGANTLKGMALIGAAQGLGKSDADLTKGEVLEAAKDATIGGATGLGLGLAGKGLGKLFKNSKTVQDTVEAGKRGLKGELLYGTEATKKATEKVGDTTKQIISNVDEALNTASEAHKQFKEGLIGKVDLENVIKNIRKQVNELTTDELNKTSKQRILKTLDSYTGKKEMPFVQELIPETKVIPAKPGTLQELTKEAELDILKLQQQGVPASYSIVPGKTESGLETLTKIIRKDSPDLGETITPKIKELVEATPEQTITKFKPGKLITKTEESFNLEPKEAFRLRGSLQDLGFDAPLAPSVEKITKQGAKEISSALKATYPGLKESDELVHRLLTLKEKLGLSTDTPENLDKLVQFGKKLASDDISGIGAKESLNELKTLFKDSPEIINKIEQELVPTIKNLDLVEKVNKVGKGTSLFEFLKSSPTAAANIAGKTASVIPGIAPAVKQSTKALSPFSKSLLFKTKQEIPDTMLDTVLPDFKQQEVEEKIEKAPVKLSQKLYKANPQELEQVQTVLKDNNIDTLSGALESAIESGNQDSKRAALFAIMQDKKARRALYEA